MFMRCRIPYVLTPVQAIKTLCVISLCFVSFFVRGQQTKQVTPGGTKFWLYTPSSYAPPSRSPVLIALHGAGTIGDDLDSMLIYKDETPAKLIKNNKWPASRPFIVVTPQLKRDYSVPDYRDQLFSPAMVDELLEYVKQNWSVDTTRVYITGLSLGGASTWLYAAAFPNKIAAMVPISGVTDTTQACLVKNIPTWVFHGGMDDLVPNVYSKGMVRNINSCTPRAYTAQLNVLHARRHEGWNEIYNDQIGGYDIYSWMLKFRKNDIVTNRSPYVNAGMDLKLLPRTDLTLYGEFFDSDGTIASVNWTQISGPAVTMDGTTTRWLKLSNLVVGTYVFQLAVTDDDAFQSTDQVTIQVLNSTPVGQVAITDLILMNGATNQDIGPLSEGYIIDPIALGTNQFNIRAVPTSSPTQSSIKVGVNGDQATRVTNPPGPYLVTSQPTGPEPEWLMTNGQYRICATPYNARSGAGTPGVSLCYTVTVNLDPSTKFFYSKPSADVSSVNGWGINGDGTGLKPQSFTANNQVFVINNSVVANNALNVSGTGSSIWVRSGGSLVINNQMSNVNAAENSTITINTAQPVTFGSLNPSSVIIFGANATTIPSSQYGNLTLMGSGSTKSLSAGTTQVNGNLTINSGVTLNGNSASVTLTGNLANSGTISPGTSSFTLSGSAAQSFSGSIIFNNLTINKSGGAVSLTGTGSTIVNGTLTLSAGNIISSSSNPLTLAVNASATGGSATSYVIGPLVKTMGGGSTFTFPLGSLAGNKFRPVTLSATSASDVWITEYKANNPTSDGYPSATFNSTKLTSVSQFEYWDVSRAGSTSASLTLSYNTGSYNPPNIGDPSKLRIAHWDGTRWDVPTGNGTVSHTGDNISGTVTVTNVTSFSPHTVGIFDPPLPVTWLSFDATRAGNTISLEWKTATERNNDRFEIERSEDGVAYNNIGKRSGAGNSSITHRYEFADHEVSASQDYYYRIRQVDFDGVFDFSKIVYVPAAEREAKWSIYPNPVRINEPVNIEHADKSANADELVDLQVTAPNGMVIWSGQNSLSEIKKSLQQLTETLKPGMYVVRLADGLHREHFRMIVH
jgi:poly(3-hydroxybutyrate) depolymerase